MYCDDGRLCVCPCVSVRRRIPTLLHEPGCNFRVSDSSVLLGRCAVVYEFGYAPNAKCQRGRLYSLYGWFLNVIVQHAAYLPRLVIVCVRFLSAIIALHLVRTSSDLPYGNGAGRINEVALRRPG